MQRRELLERMISAALAAALLAPLSLAAADSTVSKSESSSLTAKALERQLRYLAMRDSSEQSTPMFLALENLAVDTDTGNRTPGEYPEQFPHPLNKELTAKFEYYADLLLKYKSQPNESDAVELIVLMASQELVPGAMEDCL